ncbi:MAG: sigma-70 family RNA polymerase sigma factor [Clostridia bacterium]|nr:sigma-70 family RNA polymerase sigma factor [Clostridia bacterium]MBQ6932557.1 sigma-70 family RNA polymerase sigma factor [Clostridia bacterium]MBQ7100428.1 sigma-70 family RNA polymerase sigma factor [Clostridia bacterium]
MGLVHSCAARFKGKGVEYDDLFQAGCVGLIKAADGFEADRGFAFSTYAVPVILGEIRRIFRDGGSVKVSRMLKEKARLALSQKERLTRINDREPTIEELADALGLDVQETAQILNAAMPAVSLTAHEDDSRNPQLDIPVDSQETEISDKIALHQTMLTLPERDRRLIELRYFKGLTQAKTAQQLGMSQVQVSRREKVILIELRKNMI